MEWTKLIPICAKLKRILPEWKNVVDYVCCLVKSKFTLFIVAIKYESTGPTESTFELYITKKSTHDIINLVSRELCISSFRLRIDNNKLLGFYKSLRDL